MCGFTGFFQPAGFSNSFKTEVLTKMSNKISHRGPDDQGVWFDDESGIALAHRRLSIIDLSIAGHQPMKSQTGRYVVVFNGEIYNHLDLRKKINQGGQIQLWNGHSDTETLLAGFETWGIQSTVKQCVGMFAFCVWDRLQNILTLGRDRIGEKPLYYGWQGAGTQVSFVFGSELKSLKCHPSFSGQLDQNALCLFMRHGYIPSPYTIYNGISKLEPGHLLSISSEDRTPKVVQYWSLSDAAVTGNQTLLKGDERSLIEELERLMLISVKQQMIADVPVGAFLSGGMILLPLLH